jgi:hypothetical protein
MSKPELSRLLIVLLLGISAGSVRAQAPADDTAGEPTAEAVAATTDDATTSGQPQQQAQYAPSLDGTGLISLNGSAPSRLLWGVTATGGWDSNPDNVGKGISSGLYSVSPYIGLQINTPKTQYLVQYASTNTGFTAHYAEQSMHTASASVLGNISDRWSWDLKAMGSYGQDSIRFLGAQQTVAVGGVAGTGAGSASYLPDAGTVTYADASLGTQYRKSQRDTIRVSLANAFSRYSSLSGSNSIATANLSYAHDISPRLGALVYGQSSVYYGSLHCESYGGGLGLRWHPSEQTTVSLSGGPQLDNSCGSQQGFAYSASLSTNLSDKAQFYLLSDRQPTASYLGPGLWQESASAGYQRQVTSIGAVSVDVGYVASSTLKTVSSYHGTYFDFIYGYRLHRGIRCSYSYRGYIGDSGGVSFKRNVAMFSLTWAPDAAHETR